MSCTKSKLDPLRFWRIHETREDFFWISNSEPWIFEIHSENLAFSPFVAPLLFQLLLFSRTLWNFIEWKIRFIIGFYVRKIYRAFTFIMACMENGLFSTWICSKKNKSVEKRMESFWTLIKNKFRGLWVFSSWRFWIISGFKQLRVENSEDKFSSNLMGINLEEIQGFVSLSSLKFQVVRTDPWTNKKMLI